MSIRKDKLRDRIWDKVKEVALEDHSFREAVEKIGLFSFMDVVDAVADSIIEEQDGADPLAAQLDEAATEVVRLRGVIDEAAKTLAKGASPASSVDLGVGG